MASENILPVVNNASSDQHIDETEKNLVAGYPRLGSIMAVPQAAMFRRFATLNAQILLFMQTEIIDLEHDLRKVEQQDNQSNEGHRQLYCRDYSRLRNSADRDNDEDNDEHLRILMEIKTKLKEYSKLQPNTKPRSRRCNWNLDEALQLQTSLASMPKPSKYDLDIIQQHMESTDKGVMALLGKDRNVWGKWGEPLSVPPAIDLVALRPQYGEDPFSKFVIDTGMKIFYSYDCHLPREPFRGSDLVGYPVFNMLSITLRITSVLASLIPVLAIVILYYIKSMGVRLAVIAGFNAIFTLCLLTFTKATRSEVFTAIAA